MPSGDDVRLREEVGKEIRELNLLWELAESVAKKIEENQDHPEAVRVLKEIGMGLMTRIQESPFTPIPDCRPALAEKFRA